MGIKKLVACHNLTNAINTYICKNKKSEPHLAPRCKKKKKNLFK